MKDTTARDQKRRREYTRPVLRQVPLRPEEAVLGGCKTNTTNGNNGSGGGPAHCGGGVLVPCSSLVS
jgi:hypothetical protein